MDAASLPSSEAGIKYHYTPKLIKMILKSHTLIH